MFICLENRGNALVNLSNFDVVEFEDDKIIAYRTTYSEGRGYEDGDDDIYVNIESKLILCRDLSKENGRKIINEIIYAIKNGEKVYYLNTDNLY